MKVTKTFEGYGRMGRDWNNGRLFFGESPTMFDFAQLIMRAMEEKDGKQIHDLTCGIIQFDTQSITGNYYLTEKCIKYKINIDVEAELVDDKEAKE